MERGGTGLAGLSSKRTHLLNVSKMPMSANKPSIPPQKTTVDFKPDRLSFTIILPFPGKNIFSFSAEASVYPMTALSKWWQGRACPSARHAQQSPGTHEM